MPKVLVPHIWAWWLVGVGQEDQKFEVIFVHTMSFSSACNTWDPNLQKMFKLNEKVLITVSPFLLSTKVFQAPEQY